MHLSRKPLSFSLISIFGLYLLGGLTPQVLAGTAYTWTGKSRSGSIEWSVQDNWIPLNAPGQNPVSIDDTVTFPLTSGNYEVDVAVPDAIVISTMTFKGGYQITNNGFFALSSANHSGIGFQNSTPQASPITNNGNLDFSNTSTAGQANITNNGNMNFNNAADAGTSSITNNQTLNFNDASKANQAIINNTGSVYFKNTVTANQAIIKNTGGSIDVSGITGTLPALSIGSLSDSNTSGTFGTVTLGNTALSLGNLGNTDSLYSVISGNGSLTKVGTGTLTLNGHNLYTGTTTVQAGTLTLGSNGYLGTGTSTVGTDTTTATLDFINAASAHNATIINNASLRFDNNSTANQAVITNNGMLNFNDSASAGTSSITNNKTVNFNGSATANQATINNTGSVYFKDTVTANQAIIKNTGGTIDVSGITGAIPALSIGSLSDSNTSDTFGTVTLGNTALSLGNVGNAGSNDNLYSVISGNGSLIKVGAGTLTLKGVNIYSGTTEVQSGTLAVDSNATLGNGAVTVGSGAFLNFINTASASAFSPSVAHRNSLASNKITNLYGGTINGFASLGSLDNFGTLAPGDSHTIGIVNISDTFISRPNSTYQFKIDNLGNNDKLNVTGAATLNGGTVCISFLNGINGNYETNIPYPLLTAGSLQGQFDSFTQPIALNGELIYNQGQVSYQIYSLSQELASAVSTPNQASLANYLLFLDGPPSTVPSGISNELMQLTTHDEIESYLDQLSGATIANQQLAVAEAGNWFDWHMRDHIQKSQHKDQLEPWLVGRKAVDRLSNAQVEAFKDRPDELAYGVEAASQGGLFGVGLAYTRFHGHSVDSNEPSQATGNLYQVGTYGHQTLGNCLLGATLSLGVLDDMDSKRWIEGSSNYGMVHGRYHGSLFTAQAQASYLGTPFKEVNIHLQPLLGVHYQQVNRSQFAEQGNTGAELNVHGSRYRSFRSELGLAVNADLSLALQPFAQTTWEHEFSNTLNGFDANFEGLGGSFHINSVEIGREALATKAGLTVSPQPNWNIAAFYEGRFVSHLRENAGKVQIGYVFL